MKKKIAAIVIACVLVLSVGGYFVYRYVLPSKEFSLEFSEYYQGAEDFEELEPLLNQYFGAVQAAYDKSDKENLESFVLDESYEDVGAILKEMYEVSSDKMGDFWSMADAEKSSYNAALKLYRLYLKTGLIVSEKDFLLVANYNHLYKPEWFAELNDFLLEAYDECANGNGEF